MPGLHGQLTTTELANALTACDTLIGLSPYLDQMTNLKVSTLRANLVTEQQDRRHARTTALDEARKTTADA